MITAAIATKRSLGSAAYVFATLRDDIISLTLAPGTVLSRIALQERFGLSSTPIRDALLRLEEEGLVEIFPQHATLVSPIDTTRAAMGQFLRRSVETEVVRSLAAAADAEVVARLRNLVRRQQAFAELSDHDAFSQADHDFHFGMYEAAGVATLWPLVRRQGGHIDRLRRLNLPVPGKMAEIVLDHNLIVSAIEQGDGLQATEVLRDHLSRSLDFVEALQTAHPAFFTSR